MTNCLSLCESCGSILPRDLASAACPSCAVHPGTGTMRRSRYRERWTSREPFGEQDSGIPGHDLEELIGEGGMGEVHRARQDSLGRDVAVKIIVRHRQMDEHRDRFIREARVLAQLDHPNIIPIYDYGVDQENRCFYTMKLVRGRTLAAIIASMRKGGETWTVERRLEVFRKVCDGIAFAHSRGVIHRDLKPDNIMVGEFGEVLVMDWGLAGELSASEQEEVQVPAANRLRSSAPVRLTDSDVALTIEGSVIGTPQYMSPEQANASLDLDERCDIYSLGGLLYAMMTLRPPLEKTGVEEMLENVRAGRIEPFGCALKEPISDDPQRQIHARLASVVRKAMALDRELRFPSVGALASDVDAYLSGFATSAEEITFAGHFCLLVKRHRNLAIALTVLLIVSIIFLARMFASEQRATQNAFLAAHNEEMARKSESEARLALAQAQIALADSAYATNDTSQMRDALDRVPNDLRDSTWKYLNVRTDERQSILQWQGDGFLIGSAPHPTLPGVFTTATSADNHRIIDFDVRSGKPVRDFSHRGGWVRAIAYSPDGSRVALGRIMGEGISIHRAEDGAELLHWKSGWVDQLAFHPDGKRMFQSDHTGCTMWDSTTGKAVWTSPHGMTHYLLPDGEKVVSIGKVMVRLLSAEDGSVLASYPIRSVFPITASLSPDGERLIVAHLDGQVSGIRLADGSRIFEVPAGNVAAIQRTAFTPDGNRFITVAEMHGSAQSVQLRDARTGLSLRQLRGGVGGIESICIHPKSADLLVAGASSGSWALPRYREPAWRLPSAPPHAGFLGSDDTFLIPGENSGVVAMDVQSGSTIWKPALEAIGTCATSADGRTGVAQVIPPRENYRDFLIFRAEGRDVRQTAITQYGTDAWALAVNCDGSRIAVSGSWGGVNARLAANGANLPDLDPFDIGFTLDLAWHGSDPAKLLGVFTRFGRRGMPGAQEWIVSWNTDTGQRTASERSKTPVNCLASEPGGKRFVEAGDDKIVRVRDTDTLAVLHSFRAHDGPINAIAWHPSRPIIATGSADRTVRLWDVSTGRLIEELHLSLREPEALYFSPSGNRLACTIPGEKTLVWDLSDLAK